MKNCPYCNELIQDDAKKCRYCGEWLTKQHIDDSANSVRGPRISGKSTKFLIVFLGLMVVILVMAVIVLAKKPGGMDTQGTPTPEVTPTVNTKSLAWEICMDAVKQKLVSPGSAQFQNYDESLGVDYLNGNFVFTSYVDAQNGFGALLRMNFTCKVKSAGGHNWIIQDLQLTQN